MAEINLSKYGINGTTEIIHNPSYEFLFEEETKSGLTGYEKGQVSELGAVNVMTGIYTGRSPKDKYIVMDENSKDTVWWTSDEYTGQYCRGNFEKSGDDRLRHLRFRHGIQRVCGSGSIGRGGNKGSGECSLARKSGAQNRRNPWRYAERYRPAESGD